MNKEQENTLRALRTGERGKEFVVSAGLKAVSHGVAKSFDAEKAHNIVNSIDNNTSLQLGMQKANQAQRA